MLLRQHIQRLILEDLEVNHSGQIVKFLTGLPVFMPGIFVSGNLKVL